MMTIIAHTARRRTGMIKVASKRPTRRMQMWKAYAIRWPMIRKLRHDCKTLNKSLKKSIKPLKAGITNGRHKVYAMIDEIHSYGGSDNEKGADES